MIEATNNICIYRDSCRELGLFGSICNVNQVCGVKQIFEEVKERWEKRKQKKE